MGGLATPRAGPVRQSAGLARRMAGLGQRGRGLSGRRGASCWAWDAPKTVLGVCEDGFCGLGGVVVILAVRRGWEDCQDQPFDGWNDRTEIMGTWVNGGLPLRVDTAIWQDFA